ncbi:sugar ABC transporter substrate-binding protein [Pararobbsia silviterrae]|uniref:Sugar ABC transporter substrate-binding protein n=1 Tax=Pararobbsia silviterrae TaxID=1792498 RepID=A0A494XMK9_9BURK|nr:sugar ABC transporter substrate-binding protein [Pararobbsia silviterrae]RKP51858.1 sugar ABC transporter substrate-binding protein [Pararobbsia silviterrae]
MKIFARAAIAAAFAVSTVIAHAADYPAPQPLKPTAQADIGKLPSKSGGYTIAYMPPATEFNYYIAIGEGIKAKAAKAGVNTFMLAPQSGADINGQMGMIQDAITRKVDAIILSTHDEAAAAPLVKQAVAKGIAVVIVNSDILDFPTPVHAVVGYSQRKGTHLMGDYLLAHMPAKSVKIGVIAGQEGYHSTERVGGFLDAVKGKPGINIVSTLSGNWNVEGGNTAAMDMLQANPDIDVIFAANDYMIMGTSQAAKALGRSKVMLLGNDGDTAGLEQIAAGTVTATVNTAPFQMGETAFDVTMDVLSHKYKGGFVETPAQIVDKTNVLPILKDPASLYPKPSKAY